MSFEPAAIKGYLPTGNPNVAMAQHGDDRGLFVEFSREPKLMRYKSEKAGRPIYEDRDYISMTYAGGKSVNKREVKLHQDMNGGPSDPERFPKQWAAFQSQQEQAQSGTALEMMPWLTKSQIFEYKAQKIFTVESLAGMPDTATTIPGWRAARDKAIQYLSIADAGAATAALEAENKDLRTDIEMMKQQMAELMAASAKRGPGRPRKTEGDDNAEA